MVASLQGIPENSNVFRFITSGKPGKCELCPAVVEKLEAHHVCYSPEITIKICHNCHHKVHFWPNRLNEEERYKLLKLKFPEKHAQLLSQNKILGMQALAKLIAPSRSAFVRAHQKLEIKRIERPREKNLVRKPEKEPKLQHHKLFKEVNLSKIKV